VKADPIFETHIGTSGKNQTEAKPIELLVLRLLHYLGKGWTFDHLLEENIGVGEEMFRWFFHNFNDFGSTALYNAFVITPNESVSRYRHTPA
jgi:hypothetical protein